MTVFSGSSLAFLGVFQETKEKEIRKGYRSFQTPPQPSETEMCTFLLGCLLETVFTRFFLAFLGEFKETENKSNNRRWQIFSVSLPVLYTQQWSDTYFYKEIYLYAGQFWETIFTWSFLDFLGELQESEEKRNMPRQQIFSVSLPVAMHTAVAKLHSSFKNNEV